MWRVGVSPWTMKSHAWQASLLASVMAPDEQQNGKFQGCWKDFTAPPTGWWASPRQGRRPKTSRGSQLDIWTTLKFAVLLLIRRHDGRHTWVEEVLTGLKLATVKRVTTQLAFGYWWSNKCIFWNFFPSPFWDMVTLIGLFWEPWKFNFTFLMF